MLLVEKCLQILEMHKGIPSKLICKVCYWTLKRITSTEVDYS